MNKEDRLFSFCGQGGNSGPRLLNTFPIPSYVTVQLNCCSIERFVRVWFGPRTARQLSCILDKLPDL